MRFPKAAFFDVDGVLSVPQYMIDGQLKPGGTREWWEKTTAKSLDVYRFCRAPRQMTSILNTFKENDVALFVLSTEDIESAEKNKRNFIKEKYNKFFSDDTQIYVRKDNDKIATIKDYAKENDMDLQDIYYLDDTFSLIIDASSAGINAHHISEFVT